MKKMILSVALGTLVASPAFAQATPMLNQAPAYYGERIVPRHAVPSGYNHYGYSRPGYGPGVVIPGNRVNGRTDPNVQLELPRNPVADY